MKKFIIMLICFMFVVMVAGCGKQEIKQSDDLMDELRDIGAESDFYTNESPDVVAFQKELEKAYGEVWHSDNYHKDEIEIPKVKSEKTIKGEKWFPPINNSTPIDEIAPTIPYALMEDGYGVCVRYPSQPEKFTAEYLNENAFPIAFFRKVNDLCYYTVCKVEGGGYMYYFFFANNNISYEDAMKSIGVKVKYDKSGAVIQDVDKAMEYYFNDKYADVSKMDLTKEVVWRCSIYAVADVGSDADLMKAAESMPRDLYGSKWQSTNPKAVSKAISKSLLPMETLQERMAANINTEYPEEPAYGYFLLSRLWKSSSCIEIPVMVENGIATVGFSVKAFEENEFEHGKYNSQKYQTTVIDGCAGVPFTVDAYLQCRYHANINDGGYNQKSEQQTVYNSFPIAVLPGDNIYELVK